MAQKLSQLAAEESVTIGPLAHALTFTAATSWSVILIMSVACVVGAIHPAIFYQGKDRSSLAVDVVQFAGVPVLLFSVLMARRNLIWLLLWPGTLFYLLYHDLAYVFTMRPNLALVLHVVLAGLNLYAAIGVVSAINPHAARLKLAGAVYEKLGGAVLAAFGILVWIAALAGIIKVLGQSAVGPALAVHITDLLISPAWIIGGVLLWRCRPFGYVAGLGLLFQASMLFVGLILLFVLQAAICKMPFRFVDTLVVLALGTVCFVPFGLFMRGVLQRARESRIVR
jgi:hypothetical protein